MPVLIMADMMPGVNKILLITGSINWSRVCTGLWCSPCISFFTSHFGMNILKMKLCIKYVTNPFEFQWEPGPPVWAQWSQLNCCYNRFFSREHTLDCIKWMHLWMAVTQTLFEHKCTHKCKHTQNSVTHTLMFVHSGKSGWVLPCSPNVPPQEKQKVPSHPYSCLVKNLPCQTMKLPSRSLCWWEKIHPLLAQLPMNSTSKKVHSADW